MVNSFVEAGGDGNLQEDLLQNEARTIFLDELCSSPTPLQGEAGPSVSPPRGSEKESPSPYSRREPLETKPLEGRIDDSFRQPTLSPAVLENIRNSVNEIVSAQQVTPEMLTRIRGQLADPEQRNAVISQLVDQNTTAVLVGLLDGLGSVSRQSLGILRAMGNRADLSALLAGLGQERQYLDTDTELSRLIGSRGDTVLPAILQAINQDNSPRRREVLFRQLRENGYSLDCVDSLRSLITAAGDGASVSFDSNQFTVRDASGRRRGICAVSRTPDGHNNLLFSASLNAEGSIISVRSESEQLAEVLRQQVQNIGRNGSLSYDGNNIIAKDNRDRVRSVVSWDLPNNSQIATVQFEYDDNGNRALSQATVHSHAIQRRADGRYDVTWKVFTNTYDSADLAKIDVNGLALQALVLRQGQSSTALSLHGFHTYVLNNEQWNLGGIGDIMGAPRNPNPGGGRLPNLREARE